MTKRPVISAALGGRGPSHDGALDLETLLHPAQAFEHPMKVVADADLTFNEKRTVLASWASDACAVEAAPVLRQPPGGPVVRFDEVVDALRELDRQAGDRGYRPQPHYRRVLERRIPGKFGRGSSQRGDDDGVK
jgi:hypothetical protein